MIGSLFLSACLLVAQPQHATWTLKEPKYPSDFSHFDYVNPEAPKKGELSLSAYGTFDSLNPFVLKGITAAGLSPLDGSLLHASLMKASDDEGDARYGYIAKAVEISSDRKKVTFFLRDEAVFHDGSPITAEDVAFTFTLFREKGHPLYGQYYHDVDKVEVRGPKEVSFYLKNADNRELPNILGQLPVLSKAYYSKVDFGKADLTPPLGSGPYKIDQVKAGDFITYRRILNWWGEKVPANVGFYNFDKIKYIYFRDLVSRFEAFKTGVYDYYMEPVAKNWAMAFDFPAVQKGDVIKKEEEEHLPKPTQAFVFNLRNPLFQDLRVRQALNLLYDFEWMNKNLFYQSYHRTHSFFTGTPYGASSALFSADELEYLATYKDQLPATFFEDSLYVDHDFRVSKKKALNLLEQAGWILENGRLVSKTTKKPFSFQFFIYDPIYEKVVQAFARNLKSIGIEVKVRLMDPVTFQRHVEESSFEMVLLGWGPSSVPGNELVGRFGSDAAHRKGTENYGGLESPLVDVLIKDILTAKNYDEVVKRTQLFDKVVSRLRIIVPQYHSKSQKIAYWNVFGRPLKKPLDGVGLMTWWSLKNTRMD